MGIKALPFFVLLFISVVLCSLLITYPDITLEASISGLFIWWKVLFPSLFPFLVISELMIGLGIVHFIGTLLNPFMRPLFKIPGSGGFVVALSYASGYPAGAKLTTALWEKNLITRAEGERLVAFTTSSDPVFLISAVSIGFFQERCVAPMLLIAHYGAGLIVGFLMRFHKDTCEDNTRTLTSRTPHLKKQKEGRLTRALHNMDTARTIDGRSFGELLYQAIVSSFSIIVVIGGLVIFFSVIVTLLTHTGVIHIISYPIQKIFVVLQLPPLLSEGLISGLFEVTLGIKQLSSCSVTIPLMYKVAITAFVVSWGGLSVHAQVMSILSTTPLRYIPFLVAKLIHALLAAGLVFLLWNTVMDHKQPIVKCRKHHILP